MRSLTITLTESQAKYILDLVEKDIDRYVKDNLLEIQTNYQVAEKLDSLKNLYNYIGHQKFNESIFYLDHAEILVSFLGLLAHDDDLTIRRWALHNDFQPIFIQSLVEKICDYIDSHLVAWEQENET